jgi:hypothetical protein
MGETRSGGLCIRSEHPVILSKNSPFSANPPCMRLMAVRSIKLNQGESSRFSPPVLLLDWNAGFDIFEFLISNLITFATRRLFR